MPVFSYICTMKTELILPDRIPEIKEEDVKAAALRREKYSLKRDIQAREFNEAILQRLDKEREKEELMKNTLAKQVTCEKCGKEFIPENPANDTLDCPECIKDSEVS